MINDLHYLDGENQRLGVPERNVVLKRRVPKKRSGPKKKRTCKEKGDDPGWREDVESGVRPWRSREMHRDEGQGIPRGLGQ